MKSSPKIIDTLNNLLSNELTAVNQYMVHAELCGNWGYEKREKQIEKRAITEMKHAEDAYFPLPVPGGDPGREQL
jgi:bacterioferritin